MITLAKLSIRRPKVALAAWLAVAGALTLIGFGVANTVSPSITVVPGTQSSRAQQLADAQFGPTQLVPILLEGPAAQLNRQGPRLVAALRTRARTRVLSAWDTGTASAGLRPKPSAAMIVVSVDRPEKAVVRYDQPQIESLVSREIKSPLRSYITGQPSIDRALKDASLSNLRKTELIAIGILFLLLVVGLRAPVAALIVAAVGAVSTLAGFGEVALLGHVLRLDPVGVALGTMTGLVLGVGFALLILDRFHREEFPPGMTPKDTASSAINELATTGKAVLVSGTALVLALGLVALIGPTLLMISLGAGMLTCAAFATGGAVVVMPAALVLLGRRIDAFSFPAPKPLARTWAHLVDGGSWVTRHAVFAGFAATVLLAAIAVPAFALNSGAPSITQLPSNSTARIAFEEVSRVMGPGWPTPYNLIVVERNQPITTPAVLANLNRLETQIAKDQTVDSVSGPGQINSTSDQLKSFEPTLNHSAKISDQSKSQLVQLINGLSMAGSGSSQLQSGLAAASSGAGQLHSGGGAAQSGSAQLRSGLATARTGSATLQEGLNSALNGAKALRNGASTALAGASQLASGLGKGAPQVKAGLPAVATLATDSLATLNDIKTLKGQAQSAQGSLGTAVAALEKMSAAGKSDPNYGAALAALRSATGTANDMSTGLGGAVGSASGSALIAAGVKSQINLLSPQLTAAASGALQLESGLEQLRRGNAQLASGIGRLAAGGGQLTAGLGKLTDGAGQLQAGLGALSTGAGTLASGLASGVAPAGQLTSGLGTMQAAVVKARGQIPSTAQLKKLERESPGLFSSGYFVLAAVAGATQSNRNAATFTINLLHGGTAGQIMVVSKYPAGDPRTATLGSRLVSLGQSFGRHHNAEVALGGPAGSLGDLTSVARSRIWLNVVVIAVALMLVMALALRAVLLPAIATLFSLLVAAATFGVLQLLFGGSNPPLGGPGYLDPMTIIGIFTVVFGISITFATLLLMRTREAYVIDGKSKAAVRTGLRQTAAAATGAGLVMAAALIPFATTDLINVRQFGIGVAVAILLEVVIVRPVLLPAAEAVLGRSGWWPTRGPRPEEPLPTRTPATDPRTPIPVQ